MFKTRGWISLGLLSVCAVPAMAQSFRVQCPTSTITHPSAPDTEPPYSAVTYTGTSTSYTAGRTGTVNGAIKCQQISGGDGYATMGDGTQTYMFSFGPLSGLTDIANGLPGTEVPSVFNALLGNDINGNQEYLQPGDPATTGLGTLVDANGNPYNGAVGLAMDVPNVVSIYDINVIPSTSGCSPCVRVVGNAPLGVKAGDMVTIAGTGTPYDGTFAVVAATAVNPFFAANLAFTYQDASAAGQAEITESTTATAALAARIDGHVDPRPILDVGVMNGNIPAPLMAIDEDDEFFLTLTNVGMMMRPDLFEQHTVHFHGYPNASSFYDGVPDASVAINIGASFTYYYLAPDAGTYFWHCHITPPEHLQMGMVGQIYVRPRQNRVPAGVSLYTARQTQDADLRTKCVSATDILCSNPLPAVNTGVSQVAGAKYAYNDGDGSTYYDVEYPIQIHGFDPNFHFVGMTFNPEGFSDMKDKYFLLNGRSYPDTVTTGPLQTVSADGTNHFSQPLPSVINITAGQRALLRLSDLDVVEFQTLASLGIPMQVIGYNAKLLRDQAGHNLYYTTNSITLGGGESLDVILDTCVNRAVFNACTGTNAAGLPATPMAAGTYYLYTPNLDHLSNDAENFGGLMTEVHVN
jgi:FtsP/CotA-like multicopper oxidase with cupredoxin domain